MKPLNRAERTNAFYGFLVLFLLTIGVVMTVVFFSAKVQFSENKRLKDRLLELENKEKLSDSFRVRMNVVLNELTKYELTKESTSSIYLNVQAKITRMGSLVPYIPDAGTDEKKSIYQMVLENLDELNAAKRKIRNEEASAK